MKRDKREYKNLSSKFNVPKREFLQQYASIYFTRRKSLEPVLKERANFLWPGVSITTDIENDAGETILIGTIYKDMVLKPSALKDILQELSIQTPVQTFLSDSDTCILEAGFRIPLAFPSGTKEANANKLTTGVVMAVKGVKHPSGSRFEVDDWTFAEVPPTLESRISPDVSSLTKNENLIAIVSGLDPGSVHHFKQPSSLRSLQLFLLGTTMDPEQQDKRISRLVVLGNALAGTTAEYEKENKVRDLATATNSPTTNVALSSWNVEESASDTDSFFNPLSHTLCIDIVPGPKDPTSYCLPQVPLPPVYFPLCRRMKNFQSTTNPYLFEMDGLRVLVVSGQSVNNVLLYTNIESEIDALEYCVRNRHIAPTAPDTLACYPFTDDDPFVLDFDTFPHIVVSGLSTFVAATKVISSQESGPFVRLVIVPAFSTSPTMSLIGVESGAVEFLEFS